MSNDIAPRMPSLNTQRHRSPVTFEPEPPETDALPASGLVLVVDDDEIVRWSTARKLRRAGYGVLEAAGADEALICMQEHGASVGLMLSDVIMPKQNGYELWQALRIHWPRTQVLLVSGYTPVALDRHGIQTAGFSLVQKPVPNLVEIVARLIGPPQVV